MAREYDESVLEGVEQLPVREEMDRAPTAEEIEEAIGLMKQGKAAGESEEVTAELLEAEGKWVVGVLEEICGEV